METGHAIDVFLADDNLIVREGVRALIERNTELRVVGVAADYDGVVDGCAKFEPHVLVTDVRMPPSFRREGIDAAREVRSRLPGTGVVVLSQYDDPEYAVSLLASGSAGYGYLLKDRVAEGTQLADAIRSVATGGTALDPAIVEALVRPVVAPGGLTQDEERLLGLVAEGRTIKAIAALRGIPPSVVDTAVQAVFVKLAAGVSAGDQLALNRLRQLHQAIVDREEQGETLSRLLPSGLASKLRESALSIGETERVVVTVLMSDIRSYSTIAEHADPTQLAGQLNTHRAAMNKAILGEGGTVMQFVGDAVMAVFGAPFPQADHADRAVAAAAGMHALQAEINAAWLAAGLPEFGLGLGLSTGEAAAALLGSAERLEYTLVGDTVNMSQRLQQFASAGETVISSGTRNALTTPVPLTALPPQLVKGRETPVLSFKIDPAGTPWPPEGGQPEPTQAPSAHALPAEPPAAEVPAVKPPSAGSGTGTGVAETTTPALVTAAETPNAETPRASRAAGTAEREFAPAEAPQKAEGNRKWKIWKSRSGTR
ncbi:response regulator [Trebonia kvetii]|uniref:Response regulator n=1 Tax=Trebonia kvetii TaxID=2480626 RepID=A0A6P2C270_9ACTN|nr:adenylate/guanylate cyclase domain-containing protein [Trebonia kvetii]TVZ05474.1 response regulator [Trebonia kvetii]